MSAHKDGGPAFPFVDNDHCDGDSGMSLLDWFAGQALAGLLANNEYRETSKFCARDAYEFARAMLAERAKGQS